MEKKFRIRGEIYLLLSGFFFGLQPFFAKIIYAHGGDAYSLLVLRFFCKRHCICHNFYAYRYRYET